MTAASILTTAHILMALCLIAGWKARAWWQRQRRKPLWKIAASVNSSAQTRARHHVPVPIWAKGISADCLDNNHPDCRDPKCTACTCGHPGRRRTQTDQAPGDEVPMF